MFSLYTCTTTPSGISAKSERRGGKEASDAQIRALEKLGVTKPAAQWEVTCFIWTGGACRCLSASLFTENGFRRRRQSQRICLTAVKGHRYSRLNAHPIFKKGSTALRAIHPSVGSLGLTGGLIHRET